MAKNHMKRITAPKTWRVMRKTTAFITRPKPAGQTQNLTVSLNTFLKELTKTTNTSKETKYLLTKQEVQINGTRKRSHKTPVALFDVVTIPSIKKTYRLIMDNKGKLIATEADSPDKLLIKITGKTLQKKGTTQINTTTGINILEDTKKAKDYKKGDSLIITIPQQKIEKHIKREKGAQIFVTTGKHAGKSGSIKDIKDNTITIKSNDEEFQTHKEYAITLGKDKPEIKIE